jgi:ATP-dependent DNA ligase
MIRTDAPYAVGSRSRALQKRKTFRDAEFPLVDVAEASGAWTGHAKAATFRLPDGRTFGAVVAGGREARADLLANWRRYGSATVRFLSLTPDGVPVPAVAIAFHPTAGRRL